jgi:hypothetical protein
MAALVGLADGRRRRDRQLRVGRSMNMDLTHAEAGFEQRNLYRIHARILQFGFKKGYFNEHSFIAVVVDAHAQ